MLPSQKRKQIVEERYNPAAVQHKRNTLSQRSLSGRITVPPIATDHPDESNSREKHIQIPVEFSETMPPVIAHIDLDEHCGPQSPSRHIDLRRLPSQRIADMWSHSDMSQRRAGCKRNSEFISALLDASNAAEATENTETNETNGGEELPAAGGGGANTMAKRLDKDFPDPIVLVGRRVAG